MVSKPDQELLAYAREWSERFAPDTPEGESLKRMVVTDTLVTFDKLPELFRGSSIACIPHVLVANCTGENNLHRHDYYELVYVFRGSCTQHFPGKSLTMSEQSLCLLNTEALHGISIDSTDDVVFSIIIEKAAFAHLITGMSPSDSVLMDFFLRSAFTSNEGSYVHFEPREGSQARYFVRGLILEHVKQQTGSGQAMMSLLALLLIELLRTSIYTIEGQSAHALRLAPVLAYIRDHLSTASLEELSDQLGYSKGYLSRMIKELTGSSFKGIVTQMRLARASEVLALGNQTVESIALELGYYDKSHFNRAFKARFDMTPAEYRKSKAALG